MSRRRYGDVPTFTVSPLGAVLRTTATLAGLVGVLVLAADPNAIAAPRKPALVFTGLTPRALRAAYELPTETNVSASQTIALIELGGDPTLESDLAVYDRRYGLPQCTRANGCLRIVNQDGSSDSLPTNAYRSGEASIDVQEAHAICDDCRILVVEGNPRNENLITETGVEVNTAIRLGASEVTICIELYADPSEAEEGTFLAEVNNLYFNHPGVVIAVASGDCGYDETNDPEHWSFCETIRWHYASFPAKSPTVVSVGGTSLRQQGGSWTSSIWDQGGSGCSSVFAAPPWQLSVVGWSATGCGDERLSVDVAADADPHTGASIYDSTPGGDWPRAGWGIAGGTSAAAPIVAAEFALAGGAHGVAYPAQTLYAHAADSSAFDEVTNGSNGSCGTSTICQGAVGYSGPSGLGSPIGLSAFSLPGAPLPRALPSISGAAARGRILVARPGTWTNRPTWFGYRWEECDHATTDCLPMQAATGSTYRVAAENVNKSIRVMVTAGNSMGFGPPEFSLPTSVVLGTSTHAHSKRRGARREPGHR